MGAGIGLCQLTTDFLALAGNGILQLGIGTHVYGLELYHDILEVEY